ncbi:hypothetical protein [Alistipes sp. ZOR0009]|uniref:hypothetical protein n=1 Tax=Alistipes sp. ZOR0009 TaxID=1339253 RepID=UPI000A897D76|nr:hypothetical protein [Alistipes sp. ZOR0009]
MFPCFGAFGMALQSVYWGSTALQSELMKAISCFMGHFEVKMLENKNPKFEALDRSITVV